MSTDMINIRYVQLHHLADFLLPSNHKIGGCIISILLITSLWQQTECGGNRNEGNQVNRATKSPKQLFNQNNSDPLALLDDSDSNRRSNSNINSSNSNPLPILSNISVATIPLSSSSLLNTLELNYVLSFLHAEDQRALSGVNGKQPVHKQRKDKDAVARSSQVDLAPEDRRGLDEANKMSLFSSSLNVIDVESPDDTQLAHNVLIIHKPKINRTAIATLGPPIFLPKIRTTPSFGSKVTAFDQSYATPIKNNHRPSDNFWRKKFTTTTTTTNSPIYFSTIKKKPIFEEENPVLIKNNHRRPAYSYVTRQKLSTEYALYFTTPLGSSTTHRPFSRPQTTTQAPTTAQYMTPLSQATSTIVNLMKRPPIKINHVQANRLKNPDTVNSAEITVLDPPFKHGLSRLPPNTTVVHKNVVVPYKPGRPTPQPPTTTQFPVYPVVAGITNWPYQTTTTSPWARPTITWQYPASSTNAPPTTYSIMPPTFIYDTTATEDMATEKPLFDYNNITDDLIAVQSITKPATTVANVNDHHSTESIIPVPSSSHRPPTQAHAIVTVTPIKVSSPPSTFWVTQSTQKPYVNAIWAPPPPVPSKPIQAVTPMTPIYVPKPPIPAQSSLVGSWLSPLTSIFSINQNFGFLSMVRSVLFTLMVMFLPPLTFAAALMQAAG